MFHDMTVVSRSQALTSASNYRKIHANHSTKGVAAMAQNYTEQLRKDNVRDAIYEDLQNNCEVLRTSWSGNAFPANPKVGQPCYRVDEDKLYYWDGYKWSQKGGGGSAELKTMELAAATSERVSITLEGARCLDKNMMFVFVDKIAQDPSTYSMNDDGTVVNFNPAIPANAAVTLRWFDTDVGTFDTAIFASDAEFAAGELTNKAPNVKQVHSLSDQIQTSNANYVKSELQSNLLDYTTNRILEIPQDIKLELNNGILTLKAGSKVYVPNGFESDGTTPKFDVVTIENDKTASVSSFSGFVFYRSDNNSFHFEALQPTSGTTPPSADGTLYDTSTNKIKRYENSSFVYDGISFPLCKFSSGSIDQVFNGSGYIGNAIFILPGIRCQIGTGLNNGAYTSVVRNVTKVSIKEYVPGGATPRAYCLSAGGDNVFMSLDPTLAYFDSEYGYYRYRNAGTSKYIILCSYMVGSKISEFKQSSIDSIVNSNASNFSQAGRSYLSGLGMPSSRYIDLTLGASGSTYTAPANGWFYARGVTVGNGQFIRLINTKISGFSGEATVTNTVAGRGCGCILPVMKGDIIKYDYNITASILRFIYAEGEN